MVVEVKVFRKPLDDSGNLMCVHTCSLESKSRELYFYIQTYISNAICKQKKEIHIAMLLKNRYKPC